MIPQKGKFYTIHCVPDRSKGEKGYLYMGTGECISDYSSGGLYHFYLPNGQTGLFTDKEIIQEHAPYELVSDAELETWRTFDLS